MNNGDGFFTPPITEHDWLILTIAILGTIYRIYLTYVSDEQRFKPFQDVAGVLLISAIISIIIYEAAVSFNWGLTKLNIILILAIVSAKDLTDWLFLSKEGKGLILETFKQLIFKFIKK